MAISWTIEFHEDFDREFQGFDDRVRDEILAKLILLEKEGANLGRPHADTLNGSADSNMKELRVSAAGGIRRIAFAFDPGRNANLLEAGDKGGVNEDRFYRDLIRLSDSRFAGHLAIDDELCSGREAAMSRTLKDVMDGLKPDRRARNESRAEQIYQEYLTLKELRSHMEFTQTALARNMGVAQATIAQLEQRNDIHLSNLRKYVEALGVTLSIIANMPRQGPVPLTGLCDRRLASADDDSNEGLKS